MGLNEEEILRFVRSSIVSLTALELLFFLKNGHVGPKKDLIRELRSSPVAVEVALRSLEAGKLVVHDADGIYRYAPASPRWRIVRTTWKSSIR